MGAQQRLSKKNYIDLVEEGADEGLAAKVPPKPVRPMRDYLQSLVAAVLEARGAVR